MIIIVINKNSQEIGVTGTDTTRPRSRGTEHYIASRRRIFSPPPQKGFVLSHNSHSHSPLEPLRLLLVSLSQGGGGGRVEHSLAHPQSHTPRRYTFAFGPPSPPPPLQTQSGGQGVKYAPSHQYVAQSGANVQINEWMMVREPRRRPASTVATHGTPLVSYQCSKSETGWRGEIGNHSDAWRQ